MRWPPVAVSSAYRRPSESPDVLAPSPAAPSRRTRECDSRTARARRRLRTSVELVTNALKQVVVARSGLVRSRKNRVDDAEDAAGPEPLRREPFSGSDRSAMRSRVLQCPHD